MCATTVSFSQAILTTVKKVSHRPGIGKMLAIFSCTSLYLTRHPRICRDTKPGDRSHKPTRPAISRKHRLVRFPPYGAGVTQGVCNQPEMRDDFLIKQVFQILRLRFKISFTRGTSFRSTTFLDRVSPMDHGTNSSGHTRYR